jgi:hypothetical protein
MHKLKSVIITAAFAACAVYAQKDAAPAAAADAAPAPAKTAPAKSAAAAKPADAPAPAALEKPLIKSVETRSGPRGLILIINGSGPIALGGSPAAYEKATARYKEFSVKITGTTSASGDKATFNPPAELPIKEVVLANAAGGVTVTVRMRGMAKGPIDVRNSDNQVRILLTKAAQPEFHWSSEKGVISGPPPGAAPAAGVPAAGKPGAAPAGNAPQPAKSAAAPQKQAPGAPKIAPKLETPLGKEPNIAPSGEVTRKKPGGELVRYKVFGRDPFVPLVRDTASTELPNVENLRLVGVLEDASERIALVEDFKNGNKAYALRANDPIAYGKVLRVHRDKVVFLIRDFEVSRSYTLGLSK